MNTSVWTATDKAAVELQYLALAMVRGLVDTPDAARVVLTIDGQRALLGVTTAPGDVSKLIGKGGRTARSMRTVLYGVARKSGLRFELDIDGYVQGKGEDD